MGQPVPRTRRRAVGPPGAHRAAADAAPERTVDHTDPADRPRPDVDEDERFRADRPPHHDR